MSLTSSINQNEHVAHPISSRPLDKDKKGKIIDTSSMYVRKSVPIGRIWSGTMTIRLIKELWDQGKLVASLQYQREEIQTDAWKQRLIESAMKQCISSSVSLRRLPDGTYEILDGQQRLTAIRDFFLDKVLTLSNCDNGCTIQYGGYQWDVPAKVSYSELCSQHKDTWYGTEEDGIKTYGLEDLLMNHHFSVQVYDETHSDDEASEKFCALNDSEALRDQEKRNGISGLVANWVRKCSRDTLLTERESEAKPDAKWNRAQLPYFGTMKMKSNKRMNKDELLAKSLTYERHHQKLENGIYNKTMDKASVEDLYKSNEYRRKAPNLKKLTDGVKKRWAIVDMINAGARTKQWTGETSKSLTLFQITYWLEEKYGTNYRMDADVFGPLLLVALNDLVDKNNPKYKTNNRKTRFSELCSLYTPNELKEKRDMLFDELDTFPDIGIDSRDPDRFFKPEVKYKKLVTQWSPLKKKKVHFECALSGKEITEDNSDADHIHPHDFTGETVSDNLQVLAKDVNARKGTMSNDEYLEKYRDMHLKELADAAEAEKNEYMHKVKKNEYVQKVETFDYAV